MTHTGALPAALLFDFDGTVADSERVWMAAETALVVSRGRTWSRADGLQLVGRPLTQSARIILERTGIRASVEDVVSALVARVAESLRRDGVPFRPGVVALFGRARELGIPVALVTSSYRTITDAVQAALPAGTFSAVVAAEDVSRHKPDPLPYLAAARLLGVDVREAVIFEDSPSGIAAALASGAHAVAIPCMVPVEARPGLSRLASATEVTEAVLRRLAAGETLDTVGGTLTPAPPAPASEARPSRP